MGGLLKPNTIMDKQTVINAIVALNGTLATLGVDGDKEAISVVTAKILELVKQL